MEVPKTQDSLKRKEKYNTIVDLTNEIHENYKDSSLVEENLKKLQTIIECLIWADQKKQPFVEVK
jgi:hypothetical protein